MAMSTQAENRVRRWREQRWLLDTVVGQVGVEFDQARINYTAGPAGLEAMAEFRITATRVKKINDIAREYAIQAERREYRLRHALEPVRNLYNFILLDCPPALDLLTLNALVAADRLLVPMQAEYFALEGISELLTTLGRIQAAFNPTLDIEGVILTMYDERTNLAQQVTENLRRFFGAKLLKTAIPRNVRLAEAPSYGKPVALYDPRSRGAEAYRELAEEILARNNIESPKALERKAASQVKPRRESKVRFWPYA